MGQELNEEVDPRRVSSPRRSKILVAAVAFAVAAALAGCGSSDDGGSAGGSGSGTTSQADIDAAKTATEANEKELTSIGDFEPLKEPAESGKLFVWMACDFPVCKFQTDGAEAAANAAGWDFKAVNYSLADPASGVTAIKQALQLKPYAIGTTGFAKAQYASVIPALEDADTILLNAYSDGDPTGPIVANYNALDYCTTQGDRFANWFIANSDGKGKGIVTTISEVPCLKEQADQARKVVEENCAGCSLTSVPVSIADASTGKLASVVTSALQRDKSLGYVIIPNASFAQGLPAALSAAGLSDKVKIALQGGTGPDIAAMKQGQYAAMTQTNIAIDGWRAVDGALRYSQGMDQPAADVYAPTRLLTADSTNLEENDILLEPADYEDQFKKLWGVS